MRVIVGATCGPLLAVTVCLGMLSCSGPDSAEGAPSGDPGAGSTNALYNRNAAGELSVWVYDTHGGCPNLRDKDPYPLGFGFWPGSERYFVQQLEFCFAIVETEPAEISRCKQGQVDITLLDTPRVIEGEYEVKLDDGSSREGTFSATYCEPIEKE